jgi:hypothetical protein
MAIPGLRFLAFANRWFDAAIVSRVFEPLIADWQREWIDASPSQRARIRVRGTLAVAIALAASTPRALFVAPTPPVMMRRALSRSIIFTSIAGSLLTIPILLDLRAMTPSETAIAGLFILPSGIAIAFPFSMLWAADGIRRHAIATPSERLAAVRFGIIAVLFTLALTGWIVPAMNQLYREVAAPEWARPPARGVREATLDELLSKHPPQILQGRNHAAARRERHNRAVVALLPAILLWLRFGAHDAPRRRRFWPLPIAVETVLVVAIFFTSYFGSFLLEMRLGLAPGVFLWTPIAALLLAGAIRRSLARRFPGERVPA